MISTQDLSEIIPSMPEIYVSWSDYHHKIEHLAVKIYQSNWQFNQIVCIARGGLRIGDILSRIYQKPLAILATSSYSDSNQRGNLTFSRHLTMTTAKLGDRVLLVDDLVDSGVTIQQTIPWLRQHYGVLEEIRTAVLWYKGCSVFTPDYYVEHLPENPWIHQPFELYEQFDLAQLAVELDCLHKSVKEINIPLCP